MIVVNFRGVRFSASYVLSAVDVHRNGRAVAAPWIEKESDHPSDIVGRGNAADKRCVASSCESRFVTVIDH